MNTISKKIEFIVDSKDANQVSKDGSSFNILLDDGGIQIPKDALIAELTVQSCFVWYTTPNIVTDENDKFYIFGQPEGGGVSQNWILTIEQGLYDANQLNTALANALEEQGAQTTPSPLIVFSGDNSTQKIVFQFSNIDTTIDFTQSNTCRKILGMNSVVLGPYPTVPKYVYADNVAQFATVSNYLLHSDLVTQGIRKNNSYTQIIAEIPITAQPGNQNIYLPYNPTISSCIPLIGASRTSINFWLTDQNGNNLNTNSETYSARIRIEYHVPFVVTEQSGSGRKLW